MIQKSNTAQHEHRYLYLHDHIIPCLDPKTSPHLLESNCDWQDKDFTFSDTSRDTAVIMGGNLAVALGGTFYHCRCQESLSINFGIFSAIFALATLFSSLADLGISSALINFLPKVKGDRSTIISVTFWMQLGIALLLSSLSLGFSPFVRTLYQVPSHFTLSI